MRLPVRLRRWTSVGVLLAAMPLHANPVHASATAESNAENSRPNILMIVAEDMSPRVGVYGDALAKTPSIDRLASEGVMYTNMHTISGVCAPSRSSLVTGVYATSMGTHQMRTSQGRLSETIKGYEAVPPPDVKAFPELLRAGGYSTANWAKKDYQFGEPFTLWDEDDGGFWGPIDAALWRRLPEEKPWFVMMNLVSTHESYLVVPGDYPKQWAPFTNILLKERERTTTAITDPNAVSVPPYLIDSAETRASIAQHYDNIAFMDTQVQRILDALTEDGLDDNTIVIFTTDHGDPFPRAKRAIYDSGTHVPFIVRYPSGEEAGTVETRLTSFVDIAPTVLRWAGLTPPDFIQGQDLVTTAPRKYVFAGRDRMDQVQDRARSVRDERFKLIQNFISDAPYFRPLVFRDMFPSMQSLWQAQASGQLTEKQAFYFQASRPNYELYDLEADPHEINNLAGNPDYERELNRLIAALEEWYEQVGDRADVSEREMVFEMWQGASQPETAPPTAKVEALGAGVNAISLTATTKGASIGYKKNNDSWQIYTRPVRLEKTDTLLAKAIRYGYKESKEIAVPADN